MYPYRPGVALSWTLLALACGRAPEPEQRAVPHRPQLAAMLDDSVRAIVRAYEGGKVALEAATRSLADLVEPTGGFATEASMSPRTNELFQATGRELRRRDSVRREASNTQR